MRCCGDALHKCYRNVYLHEAVADQVARDVLGACPGHESLPLAPPFQRATQVPPVTIGGGGKAGLRHSTIVLGSMACDA